jgi:spore germination cell wall hydrolase CwlJ-like protein
MSRAKRVLGVVAVTLTSLTGVAMSAPSFALPAEAASVPTGVNVSSAGVVPTLTVDTRAIEAAPAADAAAPATDTDTDTPDTLAEMVAAQAIPASLDRDEECLAASVYFESKSEPLEGQLAVAEVVLNRANSGRFPKSICGVVFQPSQFSFVRGNDFPPINRASLHWKRAVAIAQIAMNDSWDSEASDALYFHARRVSPNWGKRRVATLGNHVFYR